MDPLQGLPASESEALLQALIKADFRFEVLIRSIIKVLSEKTGADGKPIMTKDEVNAASKEIKDEIIKQSKIAKPGLIVPGQ